MNKIQTIFALAIVAGAAFGQAPKTKKPVAPDTSPTSAVGGILVSPLMQRVASHSGQKEELTFTTKNPSDVRATASIELVSYTVQDGTYRPNFGIKHDHDCSAWFANQSQQVTWEPGERKELKLPLTVPRGSEGPYWCMLKFTPKPNGSQTKALVAYEIPVVMIIGKNPKPVVKIASPVLRRVNDKSLSTSMLAVLSLNNDSEGFSVLGTTGSLTNLANNRVVQDFQIEDRNLLPGTKRDMVFLVSNVPDGKYRLSFKAVLGIHSLPPVSSDIVVVKGIPKLASEVATLQTTPVVLEPSALNLAIPAGGRKGGTIRVTNTSKQPMAIEIKPVAVEQGANGSIGMGDRALPSGLSIEVEGDTPHLDPGQSTIARFTIVTDKDAKGDLWFALSVRDAGNGAALAESLLGTVSIPKTQEPNLAVEALAPVTDGPKTLALKFQVHNTGNIALRPEGSAAVLADGVRLVDRLAVPMVGDGGILPGKTVNNAVMMSQTLKPGKYVVEISYQYGPDSFARQRYPFTVYPPAHRTATKSAAKK